ncbi:hypothetical protein [Hymenobacter sp. CRA2]|uniref:hypothetical protein n=1 Tax=Hymenobacter sp. CRA2 TaxID=1955620 RepID=UPI00098F6EEA|nr:hypothetical protein [Hymenobacter sp. CRA2]OON70284.1 hypothetical protein B0919_06015 [Hymenobacter sp. CRA2]
MSLFAPPGASDAATVRRLALVLLLGYLLYLFSTAYQAIYFDSNIYWELTGRFYYETKRFNLLSFDSSIRGYLLPLLLFPLRAASYVSHIEPLTFSRVVGAGLAALLFGWIGPSLWQAVVGGQLLSWRRRLAFAGLGFLFWRDYFNFPLSDFLSLTLLLAALLLVLRRGPRPGWLLLAGALCMAAVNMRPVYVGSAGLLLIAGSWLARRRYSWPLIGRGVAAFLLGMALVGAPQLAINVRHFGQWTPLVLAWKNPAKPQSLYLSQLAWGLAVQKYETTIDPAYPDPRVMYVDPIGQRIMDQEHISYVYGLRDFGHYFTAVRHYPADMLALYARHTFNGFDLKYATPYAPRVHGSTLPLSVLNYTVLFAAALVLLHRRHRRLTPLQWLALLVVVGPCALSIPTAVECRFFIPVFLLLYAVVCFLWPRDWRTVFLRWPVAAAYVVFVLGCLVLSANTLWHMTNGPRLLWP